MRRRALLCVAAIGSCGCGKLIGLGDFEDIFVPIEAAGGGGAGGSGGATGGGGAGGVDPTAPLLFGWELARGDVLSRDCAGEPATGPGYYIAVLDPEIGSCSAQRYVSGTLEAAPALQYASEKAYWLIGGGQDAGFEQPCENAQLDGVVDAGASSQILVLTTAPPLTESHRCVQWVAGIASTSSDSLEGRDVAFGNHALYVTGALGGAAVTLRGTNGSEEQVPVGGGGLVAAFNGVGVPFWGRRFGQDGAGDPRIDAGNAIAPTASPAESTGLSVVGTIDTSTAVTTCGADASGVGPGQSVALWAALTNGDCQTLDLYGKPAAAPTDVQVGYGLAHAGARLHCRAYAAGAAGHGEVQFGAPANALPGPLGSGSDGFVVSHVNDAGTVCGPPQYYDWGARFGAAGAATAWGDRVLIASDDSALATAFAVDVAESGPLRMAPCDRGSGCTVPATDLIDLEAGRDHLIVMRLDTEGTPSWVFALRGAVVLRDAERYGPLGAPETNIAYDADRVFVSFEATAGAELTDADIRDCPALASPMSAGRYVSAWTFSASGGHTQCLWATRVAESR